METFQRLFHEQWHKLNDPHVRSLAWILTSPSMLAKDSPLWKQQIASLDLPDSCVLHTWLADLDLHPTELHVALALHKHRRLGHYAENLLAFYLKHQGILYAHGLQVHQSGLSTVGEFDFLLRMPEGLLHWEIATKFYLFEEGVEQSHRADLFDYLGPNLADTLGAKMDKIFRQQLALSHHVAAQELLPERVIAAKALVKGWLFYPQSATSHALVDGIADVHCCGYWWTREDVSQLSISYFLILDRLQWLAPAQTALSEVMEKGMLQDILHRHFQRDSSPVMLAVMQKNGDVMQEICRGMVVPDDWLLRAQKMRTAFVEQKGNLVK